MRSQNAFLESIFPASPRHRAVNNACKHHWIFFFNIFVPNRFLILYSIDLYRVPDHRRMPRTPTNIWIYALGGERERLRTWLDANTWGALTDGDAALGRRQLSQTDKERETVRNSDRENKPRNGKRARVVMNDGRDDLPKLGKKGQLRSWPAFHPKSGGRGSTSPIIPLPLSAARLVSSSGAGPRPCWPRRRLFLQSRRLGLRAARRWWTRWTGSPNLRRPVPSQVNGMVSWAHGASIISKTDEHWAIFLFYFLFFFLPAPISVVGESRSNSLKKNNPAPACISRQEKKEASLRWVSIFGKGRDRRQTKFRLKKN